MLRFLARRLVGACLVMLAVSFFTFLLLDLAPGDAADTLIGDVATVEQLEALRHQLGLDVPLPLRYGQFLVGAMQGDLGVSVISGRPVAKLVAERFAYTLWLSLAAMTVAVGLGGLAGVAAAAQPRGFVDLVIMGMITLGQALPTFWLALMLMLVFGLTLGWVPIIGGGTLRHMILPTVALSLPAAAVIARLVRSSLLDVKGADYVRTARAKGLGPVAVWRRHLLPNSLVPVITMMGLYLGQMLGGAFIVETIFGWPGLGRLMVQAIFDRDLPVVLGAVLLIAVIVQLLNIMVDLAHAWLDPRVGAEAV
ncbi:ABC transporter permease [Candidatus Viridilinea mediisalina]|uniref:Peptide ABC transporter permease n=1 Tax=Candidatus Viridilinea mediisalina TaxID=2024553 RepID=A0A2A6RIS6_9CHLR|nr:ABC transporter permease [Candidatus Viridilinea mediisalina]PDW02977.1 peptide ABC transporter permease [Candidatus Viridilinea mediisalina]